MSSGACWLKITPYFGFDGNAEAAVEFYLSLFPNSRVTKVARWGKER